jgi:hypothetical protein
VRKSSIEPYIPIDLNDGASWSSLADWLAEISSAVLVIGHGVSSYIEEEQKRPFALPALKEDVLAYHEALGYNLCEMALRSDLSSRCCPSWAGIFPCSQKAVF